MYLKGKERNLYFDNFLNLLVTGTNKVEYGRIYFLHFIVLSKVRDTGFPNVYEFKEFYLSKYDSLKDFYLTYLKEWKTYFLNSTIPNFEIPKPLSYYTAMLIYDYARFFGSEYYAVLDIVLSVNSNLLFFIKNILSISNELEAHRINKEALDLLLPEKYRDIFFEKLKTMDTLRLTDSQNQWRDFLVEYNKN